MTLLDVSRLIIAIIGPGLLMAAVRYLPRLWAAVSDRLRKPQPPEVSPYGPPIERLAADLRRLLRLHGELVASAQNSLCAQRVWAVEAAIGMRAVEAATALEVPHPHPDRAASLTRTEISALLTALAMAGLVLPARMGGFTIGGSR
ncbi:hypothetical protein [Actinoplanes sp. G11-F43]|uniref:hypothetical protein n=1 Tax=Actinoplanes sp. G11-F43 TaxID=3424130 RepID=UPI003D346ED7